jgi:hypothetical protein
MEVEIDFDDLIDKIFSGTPNIQNSLKIDLCENNNETEPLFKTLTHIFTRGMQLIFGNRSGKVNLDYITTEQFFEMNQYFRSFGYEIIYEKKSFIGNLIGTNIDGIRGDKNSKLAEHYLQIKTDKNLYKISFTKLNNE